MRDDLANYRLVRLAKRKGFEPEVNIDYNDGMSWEEPVTLSLLQKWLREVHKITVESNYLPNIGKYRCLYKPQSIIPKDFKSFKEYHLAVEKYYGKTNYNKYEEALAVGLEEGLKLLPDIEKLDISTDIENF